MRGLGPLETWGFGRRALGEGVVASALVPMVEDPVHDAGVGEDGDDDHLHLTPGTQERIDLEDAAGWPPPSDPSR